MSTVYQYYQPDALMDVSASRGTQPSIQLASNLEAHIHLEDK